MSKILLLGDFCIKDSINLGSKLKKIINDVDETIINFEGYFEEKKSEKTLGMNISTFLEISKELKIKAVSLANNHVNDGDINLTIKKLEENEIQYFGIKEKKTYIGLDYEIYGAVWKLTGGNQKELNSFFFHLNNIEKTKDKLIFFPHWGVELEKFPHPWQLYEIKKFIKQNKVDLVCGHHTHLTSLSINIEKIPVIFSLGNFFIPKTRLTNYYPRDTKKGKGIIYDTKSGNISEINFEYIESKNEIEVYSEGKIEYFKENSLKEYKNFFRLKRTKKNLPIFTEKIFFNYIKSLKNLILIFIFKSEFFRESWKKLKRR